MVNRQSKQNVQLEASCICFKGKSILLAKPGNKSQIQMAPQEEEMHLTAQCLHLSLLSASGGKEDSRCASDMWSLLLTQIPIATHTLGCCQ